MGFRAVIIGTPGSAVGFREYQGITAFIAACPISPQHFPSDGDGQQVGETGHGRELIRLLSGFQKFIRSSQYMFVTKLSKRRCRLNLIIIHLPIQLPASTDLPSHM